MRNRPMLLGKVYRRPKALGDGRIRESSIFDCVRGRRGYYRIMKYAGRGLIILNGYSSFISFALSADNSIL